MPNSRPQLPTFRSSFQAVRMALVAVAIVSAIAAGCGGGKPAAGSGSSASTGAATPGTPPATTPAATDTASSSATSTPAPSADAGDLGAKVFAQRCALCHGADGRGDGVASKGLNPKPRNFHDQAYMSSRTDTQLLEVIHKGKGVMPRWEGQLSEAEIEAVLKHVRELGTKP